MGIQLIERVKSNMKYEYNGNLIENDRINNVASDIISLYPEITINEANEIALLEGKISEDKNLDMQFNRLYNIMLVMQDNKNIVKVVARDLIDILNDNKNDYNIKYYYNIAYQILRYLSNERDFPYIDEI